MAIQHRRGSYNNFDPSRLLPGEWAVVTSDDDNVPDGKAVYICFASGDVKRLTTAEDMTAFTEYIEQVADEAEEAAEAVEQAIIGLIPTMSANIKGGAMLGDGLTVIDDVLSVDSSAIEIPPATTSRAGVVKPDGTSITVDSDGTIHGQAGGVTGVKGNSETNYRTGQVNLTPANIGAAASSHEHSAADITSGALSMTYGGTGASTESQARANLGSMPMFTCDSAASDADKIIYTSSLTPRIYNGARFLVCFTNGNTRNGTNLLLKYGNYGIPVLIDGQRTSSTNPLDLDAGDIAEFIVCQSSTFASGAHYLGKITDRKAISGGAAGTLADAEQAIADNAADIAQLGESVSQAIKVVDYRDFSQVTLAAGAHGFSSRDIPTIDGYTFIGFAAASTDTTDVVLQSTQIGFSNNTLYIGMKNVSSGTVNNQRASAQLLFIRSEFA